MDYNPEGLDQGMEQPFYMAALFKATTIALISASLFGVARKQLFLGLEEGVKAALMGRLVWFWGIATLLIALFSFD
jgi:hypothetical protein